MTKIYKIAAFSGDGIGQEVMPEGLKILDTVKHKFNLPMQIDSFDWANCDYYARHQKMMPDNWFEILSEYDAIYFGAVGWPDTVPDHISLWGSLLQFRQKFDQYVNLRPVRLFEGVQSPLKDYDAGDINYLVVRENTEGEYTAIGGKVFQGTDREFVIQESIFTRHGVDRILHYAFDLAQKTTRKKLTSATKSNGLAISMPYWDERTEAISKHYPDVSYDKQHIDILSARFVLNPDQFDIVVASNLFGDILSDLGPATTGTIGIAASANLNPEKKFPSLFEPVHGSAPDIFGQNIANPIGMIWSGAMMLDFFSQDSPIFKEAHDAILFAIEESLKAGFTTKDLGGHYSTQEVGSKIQNLIDPSAIVH